VLRFRTRPDGVFLAILDEALEFLIDQVAAAVEDFKDEPSSWAEIYPDLAKFFSPQLAQDALSKLLEASNAPRLYQLTDYHWYLGHMALQLQIDVHNDALRDEPSGLIPVGPNKIGKIDIDAILDLFFWDLDFGGGKTLLGLSGEARRDFTISDEAWSIAAGLKPHSDELTLQLWTGDPEREVATEAYPESGDHCDLPTRSRGRSLRACRQLYLRVDSERPADLEEWEYWT